MEILSNLKLQQIQLDNTNLDYISIFLNQYFTYESPNDLLVEINNIDIINDYYLYYKYKNLIDETPCLNSGYLKYINLTYRANNFNNFHGHPKSLLYGNVWMKIGMNISETCKKRFLTYYKEDIDFIVNLMKNNIDITSYKLSYRPIFDYIEFISYIPNYNIYEFVNGISMIMRYTPVEITINNINSADIFNKNQLYLKTINAIDSKLIIPANTFYKLKL
jgi:hypothetical protein